MSAKNDVSARFIAAYEYLTSAGIVPDQKAFASELSISASMVTEINKGRSAVGVTAIQNIVTVFRISGDWLLTGEGDMLKPSPEAPSQEKEPKEKVSKQPISITDTSIGELTKIIAQQSKQLTQQAREIGRLEEQVRQLTNQKARGAADAPAPDIAHVG